MLSVVRVSKQCGRQLTSAAKSKHPCLVLPQTRIFADQILVWDKRATLPIRFSFGTNEPHCLSGSRLGQTSHTAYRRRLLRSEFGVTYESNSFSSTASSWLSQSPNACFDSGDKVAVSSCQCAPLGRGTDGVRWSLEVVIGVISVG